MIRAMDGGMDTAMEGSTAGRVIAVPARGLVLLVGASGAGKSTFARRHFARTEILSSDEFRALVADDETDQTATPAAFDILGRVLVHRLRRGRLSVVDATNAKPADRRALLAVAAAARRPTVAIAFDLPEAVCQQRNAGRPGRTIGAAVVTTQWQAVRRSLADPARFLGEGYAAVHVLDDAGTIGAVTVVRDPALPRPNTPPTPRPRADRSVSRRSAARGRTA
jgi:protein phosphatase